MKWKVPRLSFVSVLLCASVTVLITTYPLTAEQRALISGRDKFIHAAVFALLTACVAWALAGCFKGRIRTLFVTAVVVVIFASIDEVVQRYVPTRTVDWRDWVANCLGVAIGLIAYALTASLIGVMSGKAGSDLGSSTDE